MNEKILNKWIERIANDQQPDGSFLSYTFSNREHRSDPTACESVFSTALILSSLCGITRELENCKNELSALRMIQKRAARFLLKQKSEQWSFNYWARGSEQAATMPYPDDLDDTACAVGALYMYDETLIGPRALARIVEVLTALETDEGGPYKTWLIADDSCSIWSDVDLAVNSNIGFMLSLFDVELSNLVALIEDAIEKRVYESPYYPTSYSIVYFITRWYKGRQLARLVDFLLDSQNEDGSWGARGNALDTALAVSSLVRACDESSIARDAISRGRHALNRFERADQWSLLPFYTGINPSGDKRRDEKYYAGSAALTAAFCLEALIIRREYHDDGTNKSDAGNIYVQNVRMFCMDRVARLPEPLSRVSGAWLERFFETKAGTDAALLVYECAGVDCGYEERSGPESLLATMSAATVFGWMAYTIYDDFFDARGDTVLLSAANMALRETVTLLSAAIFTDKNSADIAATIWRVFDEVDAANAWETECACADYEAGNYERLAARSMGHAIGPMVLLMRHGYALDSRPLALLRRFFMHYLIARQINDDAHDWEEDMRARRVTPVTCMITRSAHQVDRAASVVDIESLRSVFWSRVIIDVCDIIESHSSLAANACVRLRDVLTADTGCASAIDTRVLERMLVPLQDAAKQARTQRAKTYEFLDAYENVAG